ncbi:MAG: YqiJ family protein [Pseudomonadota bacterium]
MIDFFHPAMTPFSIALGLMLFIAALELVGMLAGLGVSDLIDSALPDFDLDADIDAELDGIDGTSGGGAFAEVLSWLAVGKVPVLVLIVSFLTAFGLAGFIGQSIFRGATGFYLHGGLAAIGAFAFALPATRHLGLGIAKVMPKEETDAVSRDSFIGQIAKVIRGEAKIGAPAEAKLKDFAGTVHYVLVEPDDEGTVFQQGDDIILVEKNGAIFRGIANTSSALESH